jgi:hypothetical protein
MHLYAVAANVPAVTQERLTAELCDLGAEFALDPATLWSAASETKTLLAAGIHHGPDRCGPRNYVARVGSSLTWFDGLPVDASGRFAAHDANALQEHWGELDGALEGQFNAGHIDLESERIELLLDTLGMTPVFLARHEGGVLASNSATLIEELLGSRLPDPLGISSFVGLGWTAGYHTLNAGVQALQGGSRHVIQDGSITEVTSFDPAILAAGRDAKPLQVPELVERMVGLTENAVHGMGHVRCALTAGRDTRVCAALLRAVGGTTDYYTAGRPGDVDIAIATEIAERFGLTHTITLYDASNTELDWTQAAASFMSQNDGLVSIGQLGDYHDLAGPQPPLNVTFWGMGGEIGRAGTGVLVATGSNVPLVRRSLAAQRWLVRAKARDDAGIMTEHAKHILNTYLDDFIDTRLAEGWKRPDIGDTFYTFERIARWGATGPRRGAPSGDIFSPFCSRVFIEYCFAITPGERFVEAVHHRLLTALSPELRHHRFDYPYPSQRPRMASAIATRQLLGAAMARSPLRRGRTATADSPGQEVHSERPFLHEWLEARLDLVREIFFSTDSDLWSYISRPRMEALLAGEETERARNQEELLRAVTIFWHFHGPPSPRRRYPIGIPEDHRQAQDLTPGLA